MAEPMHESDCARNDAPAFPAGPCTCGATSRSWPSYRMRSAFRSLMAWISNACHWFMVALLGLGGVGTPSVGQGRATTSTEI